MDPVKHYLLCSSLMYQTSSNILIWSESVRIKLAFKCKVLTYTDVTTVEYGSRARKWYKYHAEKHGHLLLLTNTYTWSYPLMIPHWTTLLRDFVWLWITSESFGVVCLGEKHLLQWQNSIHIFSYCVIVKQYYSKFTVNPVTIGHNKFARQSTDTKCVTRRAIYT